MYRVFSLSYADSPIKKQISFNNHGFYGLIIFGCGFMVAGMDDFDNCFDGCRFNGFKNEKMV